jgi:hypothetical protein
MRFFLGPLTPYFLKSIMEVIFGYKGRLYFKKTSTATIEVPAIGDKNTQARELEFLTKFRN